MKVSIIIPVYNVYDYLDKCLNSVCNQTYKDIEIIIVNDGSIDNSEEIINNYLNKYNNIIYIRDTNHGQGYARNKAIKICNGDFIMFLDSDDYIDNDMVKEMVDNIIINDSDVCVCDLTKEYSNKSVYINNFISFCDKDNVNFMLSNPGPVCKLYKRDLIVKNNVYFMENVFYEDLAFTTIVSLYINKVSYINKSFYHYVIRDNSTMRQNSFNDKINDIFKVIDYISECFDNRYSVEFEYLCIEHLLYSASLRYIDYLNTSDYLDKINSMINCYYYNNVYYKKKSFKFKIVCFLAYHKYYRLLKLLKKVG